MIDQEMGPHGPGALGHEFRQVGLDFDRVFVVGEEQQARDPTHVGVDDDADLDGLFSRGLD